MLAKLKTIPVLGFFVRYYLILILAVLTLWITENEGVFQKYGAIIYGPELFAWTLAAAALGRHFLFRNTLDKWVGDGSFTEAWQGLQPKEKLDRCLLALGLLILVAGMIFASLAK